MHTLQKNTTAKISYLYLWNFKKSFIISTKRQSLDKDRHHDQNANIFFNDNKNQK